MKKTLGITLGIATLAVGMFAFAQTINLPSLNSQDFANQSWTFTLNGTNYTVRGSDLIQMFRSNCTTSGNNTTCRLSGTQGTLTLNWSGNGNTGGTGGAVTLDRDLSRGMSGDDVRTLQIFLMDRRLLAAGNNTGFFGPLTENAVIQFQASVGLPQTGFVGPLTRAQINAL